MIFSQILPAENYEMDISSPGNLYLDQVTLELISDARVLARQVNESRPLPPEVIGKNLCRKFS